MTQAKRLSTFDARATFAAMLSAVAERGERYVVTHYGREQAAVVSMEDLRRLEQLDAALQPKPKRRPAK